MSLQIKQRTRSFSIYKHGIICFQESQESFELTPAESSSTDSSDDDSDDHSDEFDRTTTPAREMLITPPTGFSPQKYPLDENGSVLPKVASPPPPLPHSPPPTLPQSPPPTLIRSGSVTPPSVTVELGVAELLDSCRSEMVEIQQTAQVKADDRDTTPIVREFSTLGFETPSENTPINVADCSTAESEGFNSVGIVSLNDTDTLSETSTLQFKNTEEKVVPQSVLRRGDACDQSDSESESSASEKSTSFTETNKSLADDSKLDTSLVDSKQVISLVDSKQETSLADSKLEMSLADSRLDTSSELESETDNYQTTLEGTYTLQQTDTLNVCGENEISEERSVDIVDNVNNEEKYVNQDVDVNNDEIDANLKLLEQKYLEIDEEDENGEETESEESTSTDDEQSSVRETFSQSLEDTLQPGVRN